MQVSEDHPLQVQIQLQKTLHRLDAGSSPAQRPQCKVSMQDVYCPLTHQTPWEWKAAGFRTFKSISQFSLHHQRKKSRPGADTAHIRSKLCHT